MSVKAKGGQPVTALAAADFSITEEGKKAAPGTVIDVHPASGGASVFGIIVDVSESSRGERVADWEFGRVRRELSFTNHALKETLDLVRAIASASDSRAFLVAFSHRIATTTAPTRDLDEIVRALKSTTVGGGTALYDGVTHACEKILRASDVGNSTRKILFVISDGNDNSSTATRDLAVEAALRSGAVVYAISTSSRHSGYESRTPARDIDLLKLAEPTGGRAFLPENEKDLAKAFATIRQELSNQYVVTYSPPSSNDRNLQPIKVRAAGRKDLKFLAPKGYFFPQR